MSYLVPCVLPSLTSETGLPMWLFILRPPFSLTETKCRLVIFRDWAFLFSHGLSLRFFFSGYSLSDRSTCSILLLVNLWWFHLIYGIGFNVTSILRLKKRRNLLCVNLCDVYIYVIGSNTHNVKYTYTVFLLQSFVWDPYRHFVYLVRKEKEGKMEKLGNCFSLNSNLILWLLAVRFSNPFLQLQIVLYVMIWISRGSLWLLIFVEIELVMS